MLLHSNLVTLHVSVQIIFFLEKEEPNSSLRDVVLTARNAWIQADVNRFGGANACLLWKGFASRGLGVGAANHTDNTLVPPACIDT